MQRILLAQERRRGRKLVAELRKHKKGLAPLKTHTVISRQNTAILLDADVDPLIEKFSAPAG